MSFIGDFQIRFPCRGAAIDLSPAFQRRERGHLDLPVAERRLNEGSQEQSEQAPFGVGAGFPRPIAWIIDLGGEYPPLQCWAHYFFKCYKCTAKFKASPTRRRNRAGIP